MKRYVKDALDTLTGLGFDLDHEDRKLRTDRWIFTHANEPDARLTLNFRMSEPAARTVVQRAKQIVGLASSETGAVPRKARVDARRKAERAAEQNARAAAIAAAEAKEAERRARILADRRQRQVSELESLMRGRERRAPVSGVTFPGEWVTPERVADEADLPHLAVKRAIDEEILPAYRVGKDVLVKPRDAEAWLRSRGGAA